MNYSSWLISINFYPMKSGWMCHKFNVYNIPSSWELGIPFLFKSLIHDQ
ncbi:protein of unknown function [Shewanella benthica]|uniref:Uncharacterized protein n=1 Tax=Shewanella benthica TaxID=43661 RepID=A0A330M5V8_9GAMM|nr:protein of unknown function [Shewanella benthica]